MSGDSNVASPNDENLTADQLRRKQEKEEKDRAKRAKFEAKKAKQMEEAARKAAKAAAANSADTADVGNDSTLKKGKGSASQEVGQSSFVNTTPAGEKKDMSTEMARDYNPKAVEAAWYEWWKKKGFFKPEVHGDVKSNTKGTYVIPLPPPNVTGSLHLGHALTIAVEDALIRWYRMHGYASLYIPGCDHAGIATQSVVEKKLFKEHKLTRHDLGRDEFLRKVWEWKAEHGDRIYEQLSRMGGSFDWDRVCFTLDETRQNSVLEAFVKMHEDGLIYRENRLVHWCGKLNTALSDQEVDELEIKGKTNLKAHGHNPEKKYPFGLLTLFAYKVVGSTTDEEIVVATTRPETIVGDTGVAVNPTDPKYTKFHGKMLKHPFFDRHIPLVLDEKAEADFGTGAVKVTPAHDKTDYEIGKRHNLQFINILNDDNTLNENAGEFQGLPRFEARVKIVQALKSMGLYRGEQPNNMLLPVCSRSGDIIEPRLKPQWWLNCKGLAEKCKEVVRSGELKITPQQSEKIYFYWLDNIQDWCLSRQLWWGHQIPAYRVSISGAEVPEETWVSGRTREEAFSKAVKQFPMHDPKNINLEQDPDVLDTWFSSGLWPFSTLGWPEKTKDLQLFYPNALLETGKDILFFWVIRMIMMGTYFLGKAPFKEVFLHPMVRDAQGRKMSKSLGNVIDPIDVMEGISLKDLNERLQHGNLDESEIKKAIDGQRKDFPKGIPECGTDALRFGLCNYLAQSSDINLDIQRIDGYRKFCNKLWNACWFVLSKLGSDFVPNPSENLNGNESASELWVLSKLNKVCAAVDKGFREYNFMIATSEIHSFWIYTFCGTFLEISKKILSELEATKKDPARISSVKNTLYTCLEYGLRLLHPFMPYVTEELFQRLPRRPKDKIESICISPYPVSREEWSNDSVEQDFGYILQVAESVRSLLANYEVGNEPQVYLKCNTTGNAYYNLLNEQELVIHALQPKKTIGTLKLLEYNEDIPVGCIVNNPNNPHYSAFLMVKGFIDLHQEIDKVGSRLETKVTQRTKLIANMEREGYATNVTDFQKETDGKKLQETSDEISVLETVLESLSLLMNKSNV